MAKLNHKLELFIFYYLLLKIQSGEYPVNSCLPSERSLSVKFSCSNSLIRNIYTKCKSLNLVQNIKNKNWIVLPFNSKSLLGFEPINKPATVQLIEPQDFCFFEKSDLDQLKKIANKQRLCLNNYIFLKKVFHNKKTKEVEAISYYAINFKKIFDLDLKLFEKSVVQFFAKQGLAVVQKNKKIVAIKFLEAAKKETLFKLCLYYVTYDQYNDVLFYNKTIFYNNTTLEEEKMEYTF